MIELYAREICKHCAGSGHEPNSARFLTCINCKGARYINYWIAIEDLTLSAELTQAIKDAFVRRSSK